MFICADHGNAEQLIDEETGEPFTAHTTNPVPFILVNADPAYKLREGGCLADIAPTLIELMGMQQPAGYDWKIIISKIVNIFARNHENGSGCFAYTMSKVQICACTRICTWRMYITWLLSEIVYKVYESSRSQPTRLSEEQNILQEKRKYAAYKSDLLFLKSIEMEKCMK